MIIDAFLYNGEVDMLRCHVAQTAPYVDMHVALERNKTITGELRAFSRSPDDLKNLIIVDDDTDGPDDPWAYEDQSRELLMQYVQGVPTRGEEAFVIFGDVDEIPNCPWISHRVLRTGPRVLSLHHNVFNLGWRDPADWLGPFIGLVKDFNPKEMGELRRQRSTYKPVPHAGWHLSWFGSMDERRQKVINSPHTDYQWMAKPGILERMVMTGEIWNGIQLVPDLGSEGGRPTWVEDGHSPQGWWTQ